MSYSWAKEFINTGNIKIIFELGARDCLDSISLAKQYKDAKIFTFEPNPDSFEICEKNLRESPLNTQITFIPKAISDTNGIIDFWKCDLNTYSNIGISSLFPIDFSKREEIISHPETPLQVCVQVECIRLDEFIEKENCIPSMLCMDIQEGELLALKGCGVYLTKIHYIVLEVSLQGTYKGGCTFKDINDFLKENGFEYIYSTHYRTEFPPDEIPEKGYCFFDCIFKNKRV